MVHRYLRAEWVNGKYQIQAIAASQYTSHRDPGPVKQTQLLRLDAKS